MRKDLKNHNYLFPMPVLIISTYNEDGSVDCMNAAWGTMEDSDVIEIQLTEGHMTSKNILRNKAFTIAPLDKKNVIPGDFVGIVSANDDKDKFNKTLWHTSKASMVNAPTIEDFPLSLECELIRVSHENGDFEVFGKIKNISVREDVLDENGHLSIDKCEFVTFCSADNTYRLVGERVASAFQAGLKLK